MRDLTYIELPRAMIRKGFGLKLLIVWGEEKQREKIEFELSLLTSGESMLSLNNLFFLFLGEVLLLLIGLLLLLLGLLVVLERLLVVLEPAVVALAGAVESTAASASPVRSTV